MKRLALSACVTSFTILVAAGLMPACGGDDDSSNSAGSGGAAGSVDGGPDGEAGSGGSGGSGATGGSGGSGDAAIDAPPLPPDATAVLEVYPMDLWAQFLPTQDYTIEITESGNAVSYGGAPVLQVALVDAADYLIRLSAPDHRSLEVSVNYDGSGTLTSSTLLKGSGAEDQGVSFSHEMREVDGLNLPVHSLYLGLRHLWFSAQGRPARRGNDITLLMDGEEAWGTVHEDLSVATDNVMVSTWWWESNFELVRDAATHHTLSATERWENTILGTLESRPALKRVLVGQFWSQDSILDWMTTDDELAAYAEAANDNFEFMGMANETAGVFMFEPSTFAFGERVRDRHTETASRDFESETAIESNVPARQVDLTQWPIGVEVQHASYHQKFMVIDDELAFVGGMNFRRVDWDTSEHLVFEHRRMLFDATQAEREEVMNKEELPENGPRKDYMVRLHGPAAQDVADVFQKRWSNQISEQVAYSENSSDFTVERSIASAGSHQVQVTATLPQPFWEHAIAESWFNAVEMAEEYIFIEDQYFRVPMLNDVIQQRMQAVPGLRLIVITKPVSEWTDPGCAWTAQSHALFKTNFPDRYMMLQLRSFDTVVTWGVNETESRYQNMDVHSKMLIVDDKFMSVGSCNKNNRGIVYEGELNVAILDATWVRDARRRIFENMLPAGTAATDDVATWWNQFEQAASWNDSVYANWEAEGFDISLDGSPLPAEYTPDGFVHSLDFDPLSECLFESVGPDMVGHED